MLPFSVAKPIHSIIFSNDNEKRVTTEKIIPSIVETFKITQVVGFKQLYYMHCTISIYWSISEVLNLFMVRANMNNGL